MSGANSIFGHIHAARANAELWRAKVDDAERPLEALDSVHSKWPGTSRLRAPVRSAAGPLCPV